MSLLPSKRKDDAHDLNIGGFSLSEIMDAIPSSNPGYDPVKVAEDSIGKQRELYDKYQAGQQAYLDEIKKAAEKMHAASKPGFWDAVQELGDRWRLANASKIQASAPSADLSDYRNSVQRDISRNSAKRRERGANARQEYEALASWLNAKRQGELDAYRMESGFMDKREAAAKDAWNMDRAEQDRKTALGMNIMNMGLSYEAKKSAERTARIKMQYDLLKDGHEGVAKSLDNFLKQRDDSTGYKTAQSGLVSIANARQALEQGTGIGDIVALRQFMSGVANEAKNTTDAENRAYLGQSYDILSQVLNRAEMIGEGGFTKQQRESIEQALNIVENNMNSVARRVTEDFYNRYRLSGDYIPGTKPGDWKERGYVAFGLTNPMPTPKPVNPKLNSDFTKKNAEAKGESYGSQLGDAAAKVGSRLVSGGKDNKEEKQDGEFTLQSVSEWLKKWSQGSQK